MGRLFSLLANPPEGFSCSAPSKRQLLSGHIALLVEDIEDAFVLLDNFRQRVQGLLITPGDNFAHNELAPQLWHITTPTDFMPQLPHLAACSLDIMKKANQENEKNAVMIADMAYNSHIYTQTREGYNTAMERLQIKMEEAKHEIDRRKEAIAQLNHEISERKKAQEKHLRLEARLHQAQKMEAIGLMAGGVAHDLNNILAGVVGYPDLLLLTLPEDSSLRQPLQRIKQSGTRAAEVVTDLLTIARSSASPNEVGNLNTLLYQYLDSLEFKSLKGLHSGVKFELDLDDALVNIYCSKSHIKKCLMNLITNGAESITKSGSLSIKSRNQNFQQDEQLGDQVIKKGRYAVLTVEDNGQGIAKEHLAHIFEPFYSRKKMGRSGTGLGLTVVWNTVHDNKGTIQVKSSSKGTCFTLYFPMTSRMLPQDAEKIPIKELQGNKETIMVVDDEELLRDVSQTMLRQLDYEVVLMPSGEEAIKHIRHNDVDLIILDMAMDPGISGRQTYEEILVFKPHQRAIIASGYAEDKDTKKVLSLGANAFLRKPYTINALGQAVRDALQQCTR